MKSSRILMTILEVLFLACYISASTDLEREQKILQSILDPGSYNPTIRAAANGTGPVIVKVNMYIRGIERIDDLNREFLLQVTFRQAWRDGRLSYIRHPEANDKIKYLTVVNPDRLWTPDVFFSNERDGHFHNIVKPNVLLRIFPNGDILYSTRLSLKLSCPMDLKYYPLDKQVCSLVLASYGYTTEDLVFLWKEGDAVQISRSLNTPRFTLEKFFTDYCTSRTNTGEYTCLKVDFLFDRELHHYFMEIYMPSIILVIISWICFWLNPKATTARVLVWMTVFLVFSMKICALKKEVPSTDYSTAYDTWITTCFLFLVAVIFQIGAVGFFFSKKERRSASDKASAENDCIKKRNPSEDEPQRQSNAIFRLYRILLRRYPLPEHKIDVFCRILFPLAFGLFNIIYWSCTTKRHD